MGEEGRKKHMKKFRDFFLKYWTTYNFFMSQFLRQGMAKPTP